MTSTRVQNLRYALQTLATQIRNLEMSVYTDVETYRHKREHEVAQGGVGGTGIYSDVEEFRRQRKEEVDRLKEEYEAMQDEISKIEAQDNELQDEYNRPRGIFG